MSTLSGKGRFLAVAAAIAVAGFLAGLFAARQGSYLRLQVQMAEWARRDMARTAALWGFQYARPAEAERLVGLHATAMEQCNPKNSADYPCRGRARLEAYMMMAALKEDAGDPSAAESWVTKATAECRERKAADCSVETARRGVERLRELRRKNVSSEK
jgi:hypothetical protein